MLKHSSGFQQFCHHCLLVFPVVSDLGQEEELGRPEKWPHSTPFGAREEEEERKREAAK